MLPSPCCHPELVEGSPQLYTAVMNRLLFRDTRNQLTGKRTVSPAATRRIWGEDGFRVFLCHKVEVKRKTSDLKDRLSLFNVSSFVAHKDIHPTKAWQDEIENALSTADALVALMTKRFHKSNWTDQEIGYAFGRGVPIVSLHFGKCPYGFIGKFQALSCTWEAAAVEIVKLLVKDERMLNCFIRAVQNCQNWIDGNQLAEVLPSIDKLSIKQADALITAFNQNEEVSGSFGFNGSKSSVHGEGLAYHLNRLTKRTHKLTNSGKIKVV